MSSTTDVDRAASAAGELRGRLGPDRVLTTGPAYEQARQIWNGAVDHEPALIVRAESTNGRVLEPHTVERRGTAGSDCLTC